MAVSSKIETGLMFNWFTSAIPGNMSKNATIFGLDQTVGRTVVDSREAYVDPSREDSQNPGSALRKMKLVIA